MDPLLDTDHRISRLARAQEGIVRHRDLRRIGVTQGQIRHRRETGRLIDVHPLVYAVGHDRLSVGARRLAGVWTYGDRAVLSHRTAAATWGLRASGGSRIEVTVASTAGLVERAGTRLQRTSRPVESTHIDLLPVTTPARTILDLAGILAPHHVEAALKQAELLDLFDLRALRAVVAAHPRHPGRKTLERLLDEAGRRGLTLTLSELEIHFRALCDAHHLPYPAVNARPLGFRVDFLWPAARLVAETDGWASHRTRAAFEDDRARDQALAVAGYRTVRFTHRQVVDDPNGVAATLSTLVAS